MSPMELTLTTFTPRPGLALAQNADYQGLVEQFGRALKVVLAKDDAIEPNIKLGDKQAVINALKFFEWVRTHTAEEWAHGVSLKKEHIYDACGNPHHYIHRELRDCLTKVTEGNRRRGIPPTWKLSKAHLRGLGKFVAKSIAINAAAAVREMEAAERRMQDASELEELLSTQPQMQYQQDARLAEEQRIKALQVPREVRMLDAAQGLINLDAALKVTIGQMDDEDHYMEHKQRHAAEEAAVQAEVRARNRK